MERGNASVSTVAYLAESTIGDQARRGAKSSSKARGRSALDSTEVRERIAQKAYELYLERGKIHGCDVADWLEAERTVLAEMNPESAASRSGRLQTRRAPRKES